MPRLAIGLPLVLVTATASAQPAGTFAVDEFRPAIDSRGYLTLNGSQVLDDRDVSFGLGSLEWGRHLLAFQNGSSVDNMVSATLVGALGLRLAGVPFELGASMPFSIMSGNTSPNAGHLDEQGVGNLGFHVKARFLHAGPLGVGAIASVYLPTASQPFLGEPSVTPQVVGVADLTLGRLRLAANGGVRLRQTQTYSDSMTMGTVTTSTELPVGVAAAWALAPQKLELVGEVFGAVALGDHHGYQPLEALGGVKVYLAKNSYLSVGAGRGLVPTQAGNPDFRAVIGIVFEPKPADRVSAHIPDDDVVAVAPPPPKPVPDEEADRDGDGIPDKDDKCPDEPGDWFNEGCPDRGLTKIVGSQIVILKSIEFEFDKAVLRPSAYEILDAVATSLIDNPGIELVEVQGHTDEQGDDAYNLELSNRRAAAVVAYLTKLKVAPSRLRSQGYGETRPIDLHHTQEAYIKNRRVEFVIEKRSDM